MTPPKVNDILKHDFSFTEKQLLTYPNISGDINPIYVSAQFDTQTTFGRCIVNGYFTNSIFSKFYGTLLYPIEHILVNQSAKYLKPDFTDIEYTSVFTIIAIDTIKNRVTYSNEIFEKKSIELKVTGKTTLMNKTHFR